MIPVNQTLKQRYPEAKIDVLAEQRNAAIFNLCPQVDKVLQYDTGGRLDLLDGILHSLALQAFPRERFEVILVEDQGGTEAGRKFIHTGERRFP